MCLFFRLYTNAHSKENKKKVTRALIDSDIVTLVVRLSAVAVAIVDITTSSVNVNIYTNIPHVYHKTGQSESSSRTMVVMVVLSSILSI